jgi:hypothetical protein
LLGAQETLTNYKPLLIIEFHSLNLLKNGYGLLTALGYQLKTEKTQINDAYIAQIDSFYGNVFCYQSKL